MRGSLDRFNRLSTWLRARYGERVYKVSLRGGFTCPNRDGTLGRSGCLFCAGDALEPVGYTADQDVAEQLRRGMDYVRARHGARRFIAYFQDYSATYGDPGALAARYRPALAPPEVVGLALGTRPDCLPPVVIDLLVELHARRDLWVEIGLQIAEDDVLSDLGRGHTVEDFCQAVDACQDRGLPVCAHVILGLPGVSPEIELRTASLLGDMGVWGVKLHAFHVVAGTPIAARHAAGQAAVLDREAYVERVVDVLEQLPASTVIHRITAEAPRRLTVAPRWTVNKLAVYDAVVARLEARDTWQGRSLGAPRPG